MNLQYKLLRRAVFFFGDLRRLRKFPFVTWDVSEHLIDYDEIAEAVKHLEVGDIVLHRDSGFASNCFIPGIMIHAGIYVGNGKLIEAISEGVKKRHVTHILHSDYAIILRPQLSDRQKAVAVHEAERLEGFPYDCLFNFCDEKDREDILNFDKVIPMCCTEIPHFAFMPYDLHILRRRNVSLITRILNFFGLHPGETVVDADMYVLADTKIIWKSKHFTADFAKKNKCLPEYEKKLRLFEEREAVKK